LTTAYRRIGFLVSGLVHAGLLLVVMLPGASGVETVVQEQPLDLRLEIFASPPAPAPAEEREAAVEPLEMPPPEPTPEPAAELEDEMPAATVEEPEPSPAARQQPRQEPVPEAAAEPDPEIRPGPLPDPPAEPEPPPVNKPRPAAKPLPQTPVARRSQPPEPLPEVQTTPAPARADPAMAAPAQPAPVRPPVDAGRVAATEQAYLVRLAAHIERHRFYPRMSRRLREQGTVVLRLVLQRDGEFAEIAVNDPSDHDRLDEAALETLRKVGRFDPIPDVLQRERWSILVPIDYRLR
jgi:protein TonB